MMKGKVEKVEKEGKRRRVGKKETKRGNEEGKRRGETKRGNEEGREEENEEGRGMKKVHRGFLCS